MEVDLARKEPKIDMELEQICFGSEWESFVDENSRAMFQTALLLALNPQQAADVLIASIGSLDVSRQPRLDDFRTWERAVVKLTVETGLAPSTKECVSLARPLLQPGLRPLTRISQLPRISFILRLLLGYSVGACARILGIEESEIPPLVAEAATQLQQTATVPLSSRACQR